MTTQTVFALVSKLFQTPDEAVRVANVLDKAYADATDPTFHTPFGIDNPQMVAMNQAGLYAADTAANLLSATAEGGPTEEAYLAALKLVAEGSLTPAQKYLVKNCANLAWRAGQPFRDIGSKPLNRITRDINAQFNTLPEDEKDKDLVQTRTGAKLILQWIEAQQTT